MNLEEIMLSLEGFMKDYGLPIIQSLISPIIAGTLVWWLTNRKANKAEVNNLLRQKNEIKNSLESIVNHIKSMNRKLEYGTELSKAIEEMKNGYFDEYKTEFQTDNEYLCLEEYKKYRIINSKEISELKKYVEDEYHRFKTLSINLLPPDIHKEVNKIAIRNYAQLDTLEYEELIKKLK